jgi:hypothetical protein
MVGIKAYAYGKLGNMKAQTAIKNVNIGRHKFTIVGSIIS